MNEVKNVALKKYVADAIKKIAIRKANANCLGFMYEPRKPKCLKKH